MAEAAGSAEVVSVAGMEMEAGLAVGAALEAALVPPLLEALLGAPGEVMEVEVMEVEVMEVEVMEAGVAVGEETVRCPTSALPSALPYLCAALCAALPSALPYLCAALPLRCPLERRGGGVARSSRGRSIHPRRWHPRQWHPRRWHPLLLPLLLPLRLPLLLPLLLPALAGEARRGALQAEREAQPGALLLTTYYLLLTTYYLLLTKWRGAARSLASPCPCQEARPGQPGHLVSSK
jgi:hypothetical protein